MNRYSQNKIKIKEVDQKRYYSSTRYPEIKRDETDIYIQVQKTDRLDLIAYTYYGDVSLWFVIAKCNNLGKGTLYIGDTLQLRIPNPNRMNQIINDIYKENSK